MSRIPYLTAEDLSDEQRRLAEKLATSRGGRLMGPRAFWLRNPALAEQAEAWRLLIITFHAEWRYFGHFHWRSDERRVSPMGVRGTLLRKSASRQSKLGVPLLLQEVSGSPHRDLTVYLRQSWRSKVSYTLSRVSRPYRHFRCHVTSSIPPLHAIDHQVGEGHDTRY